MEGDQRKCPSAGDLSSYWDTGRSLFPEFDEHVAGCDRCLTLLAWQTRLGGEGGASSLPSRRLVRVAAALVVLASILGTTALLRGGVRDVSLREAVYVAGAERRTVLAGEAIESGATGATLSFGDGTVVRLDAGSRARIESPAGGERLRLTLAAGAADLDVAHAPGGVTVACAGGAVRVLGTRFRVERLPSPFAGRGGESLAQIDVREGRVALEAGGGRIEVGPAQVGYLWRGGVRAIPAPGEPSAAQAERVADRLALLLGSAALPVETDLLCAALRRQGEHGARVAVARAARAPADSSVRAAWLDVLRAFEVGP